MPEHVGKALPGGRRETIAITDSRAKALKAGNDVPHWQRVEPDGGVDRDTAGYSAAQHRRLPEG